MMVGGRSNGKGHLRAKSNFLNGFNLILVVQSPQQKYSA